MDSRDGGRRATARDLPVSDARLALLGAAVEKWVGQLIDLGGRNRLLYYRDFPRATLDLTPGSDGLNDVAVEGLLDGRRVDLKSLFPVEPKRADAARRCRTIYAKALENLEERGIETLLLGRAMATWAAARGSATPAAPVLLYPLELKRRGAAGEDFSLELAGDVEVNPVLLHMLQVDFGVEAAPDDLADRLGNSGDDVPALTAFLVKAAAAVPGFAIANDRVVVSNFSYAKLPMVKDLQENVAKLAAHELIAAIAGDKEAQDLVREHIEEVDPFLPNHMPLRDEFLVLDTDRSQAHAINTALAGESIIIQGPPGTGKSQTIANLIATLAARGQSVLFVAEKRAAIEAVIKRLHEVGLADLVMDLHGGITSRRQLAENVSVALHTLGNTPRRDLEELHRNLDQRRSELVEHVAALHAPRQPWGISLFDLQSRLLRYRADGTGGRRLRGSALAGLRGSSLDQIRNTVNELVNLQQDENSARDRPWKGATIDTLEDADRVYDELVTLRSDVLPDAEALLLEVVTKCGLRPPPSLAEWESTTSLLLAVREISKVARAEVFDADLTALASSLQRSAAGAVARAAARISSSDYRQALRTARNLLHEGVPSSPEQVSSVISRARAVGEAWIQRSSQRPCVPAHLDELCSGFDVVKKLVLSLSAVLPERRFGHLSLDALHDELDALLAGSPELFRLPRIRELRGSLGQAGLEPFVRDVLQARVSARDAHSRLEELRLRSIYDQLLSADPRIAAFDSRTHNQRAREFRRLDLQHRVTTPARVQRAVAEAAVGARDQHAAENQLVTNESKRKRGHLPARQLFREAPNVLTAMKPCWTMSPLLVSQVLPPERCFDVVVFDEASQILPADAIPALLRANQAVVAGDTRQLPPTTFFVTGTSEEEEARAAGDLALTEGYESILNVLDAVLRPFWLRWHYRSRDERLIAFSNTHIYDRMLVTFPGVVGDDCLSHEVVPFRAGGLDESESGGAEVQKVVDLIFEHARTRPDESLGVIAMGIRHADRLEATRLAQVQMLAQLPVEGAKYEEFFDDKRPERFFIKNLERVQGDERDAIILSVGYGKTPDGRLLYHFGPVNQEGGERRLNVAVTRARRRMTLVSSFTHHDMDPNRLRAKGPALLRSYLQYAASGGENLGTAALETPELNPFEISVRDRLSAAGMNLVPQFGISGYRIDFAAAHPDRPGDLIVAIECDGASYHSSYTARDHDRLRQQVLEDLGWRFVRIWSSAWFRNPDAETRRVLAEWRRAAQEVDDERARGSESSPWPHEIDDGAAVESLPGRARGPKPSFVVPGMPITEYSQPQLTQLIRWIESDTLLRTEDELFEELVQVLGFRRRGNRIRDAIYDAIRAVRGV